MTRVVNSPYGYRLGLPQGWIGLNVREDIDAVVAKALCEIDFEVLPRDERPKRRAAIEGRLRSAIANAKKADAYAVYLPLHGMHGVAVPASFIVAEATDFTGTGSPNEVLAQLLAEPGAVAVSVDHTEAVRTESAASATDDVSGLELGARQIVYTIPVPDGRKWLIVVYDVLAPAQTGMAVDAEEMQGYVEFTDALVALFDSVMTTFRWNFAD